MSAKALAAEVQTRPNWRARARHHLALTAVDEPGMGEVRASRTLLRVAFLVRALNLFEGLMAMFIQPSAYRNLWLAASWWVVVVSWSWLLLRRSRTSSDGRVGAVAAWTDVGVGLATMVVLAVACQPADATKWANWSAVLAMAVALVAGLELRSSQGAGAVLLLDGVFVISVLPTLQFGTEMLSNGAADLITIPAFWLFALLASVYLRRSGREVDHGAMALAAEQSARAADAAATRAQAEARVQSDRNFRMLHDTVLSTLAAAASGSVAPARLAERAIVDERLLRQMINGQVTGDPRSLTDQLAATAARWELDGLHVDLVLDRSAPDPPAEVVRALAEAADAALANVARHTGTGEAWVTVVVEKAESVVAVVDHGGGFAPDSARADAYGVRESITGRMAACGGVANIDSGPDGTSVRLVWPRPDGLSRPPS
jgi:hypothetical protein